MTDLRLFVNSFLDDDPTGAVYVPWGLVNEFCHQHYPFVISLRFSPERCHAARQWCLEQWGRAAYRKSVQHGETHGFYCATNSTWHTLYGDTFFFKEQKDAMMFKVFWG
jgi:hypothetical protein